MASYRYTRDIKPEDITQKPEKEYSQKEKRRNFWHYNWKWLLLILPVVLIIYIVVDASTQEKPDLSIAVLAPYAMPDSLLAELENQLEPIVGDSNGDGKTVVTVEQITITTGDAQQGQNPYMQMGGVVRMAGLIQTGEPNIFIVDDAAVEEYIEDYNMFGTKDGFAATGAEGLDDISFAYGSLPVLAGIQLNLPMQDGTTENFTPALANFRVGILPIFGTPLENDEAAVQRWQAATEFINAMGGGGE